MEAHCFAVVIARMGDRFLMVHERKFGTTWSLPMGRLDPLETFAEAAVRETREEAGVDVELDGIVRVEHTPLPDCVRVRVMFVAHPRGDATPKSEPDDESLGAAWCTRDEIAKLALRGPEMLSLVDWVLRGAKVMPLSMVVPEGSPYV
jgi:phosphatase NudJ